MKIKGLSGSVQGEMLVQQLEDEGSSLPKNDNNNQPLAENDFFDVDVSNNRLRIIMKEMKLTQSEVSKNQMYLDNLLLVKDELENNKENNDLYQKFIHLSHNVKFNNQLIMKEIIPEKKDFYQNPENIEQLSNRVNQTIEKVKTEIDNSREQINRYSISVENIRAFISAKEISQMKDVFQENRLYKKINSDIVISLIQ